MLPQRTDFAPEAAFARQRALSEFLTRCMIVVLPAALAGAKRAGGDKSERQHVTAPDGRRFSHKTEYGDHAREVAGERQVLSLIHI